MRVVIGNAARIGVMVVLLTAPRARAAPNSWTNAASGKWEVPANWSLLAAPSSSQTAIFITNVNTKTVTFDTASTNSLTISNLTVTGVAGKTNTLALINAGTNSPLRVINALTLNTGGALILTNSALSVGGVCKLDGIVALASGSATLSQAVTLGSAANRTGTVTVTGGQLIATNAPTLVGSNSVGRLTVTNGTVLLQEVSIGDDVGGRGTITLTGGVTSASADFTVGNGAGATGDAWLKAGTLVVTNGTTSLGYEATGQLTVSNGTLLVRDITVGDLFGSQGSFTVAGGVVTLKSGLLLGDFDGATGTVRVTAGQLLSNNSVVTIGGSGLGQLTVTGGTVQVSAVIVGNISPARGTLTVAAGAMTISSTLSLGNTPGAIGVVRVSAGQLTVTNDQTSVGNNGIGLLTVAGGTMLARDIRVGPFAGSPGTLTVGGGALTLSSNLVAGSASGATGTLWVTSGQLTVTNAATEVGRFGVGRLTVSNATVLARDVVVARFATAAGTVTLAGGTLSADRLFLTNTTSRFAFTNGTLNTKSATVANGQLFTVGNGTLAATLNLQGGTNSFANGLRISNNATLTGTGTISAIVTNAGVIAPGASAGRLNINGNVVLQSTSALRFELGGYAQGTEYDYLSVAGNVTVTGMLAVTFINNFHTTITNGAGFSVLTGNAISGSFANATNGSRLVTTDGFGSFKVNYGPTLTLSLFIAADSDGDGLPDWWEQAFFGSATGGVAAADSDGDGFTNLQEFQAGTIPTNAASALRITAIAVSGTNVIISFASINGKQYVVDYKSNITDLAWSTLAANVAGTGGVVPITDPGSAGLARRFYRVRLVP